MPELGIPWLQKKCHEVPTFGCQRCITAQRDAWEREAYLAWAKTYKPKNCPVHKKPLKLFSYHRNEDGRLIGIAECQFLNGPEHLFECEDYDDCVVIG